MFARLLLLFILVPLAELALLVWVGERIGLGPTIALVVVTGILGASLARWQGFSTLERLRAALDRGRLPAQELLEGILILIAGAVLLTPGLLTDVAGFLLLLPPVRRLLVGWLGRWLERRFVVPTVAGVAPEPGAGRRPAQVVDVEVVRSGPDEPPGGGRSKLLD